MATIAPGLGLGLGLAWRGATKPANCGERGMIALAGLSQEGGGVCVALRRFRVLFEQIVSRCFLFLFENVIFIFHSFGSFVLHFFEYTIENKNIIFTMRNLRNLRMRKSKVLNTKKNGTHL